VQKRFGPHVALCLALFGAAACSLTPPVANPIPTIPHGATATPTLPAPSSPTLAAPPTIAITAGPSQGVATAPAVDFCADQRASELIRILGEALRSTDGAVLASIVDPLHGMDVQLLRNGTVVNYDREHAAHLFESTYSLDWGLAAGSGLPVHGSFRELVVPALLDVLSRDYSLSCNVLRVGGATYEPVWPFPGLDFDSAYFAGTDAYGGLDWKTWAVGMQYVDGKPYLRALAQFQWEP
jgi:hypothetical protein